MDLSKLSDADLDAVLAGDMSRVSSRGLDIISGTAPKPQGGFKAAVSAGIEGLKGAGYALAGRTGLMDTAEAEAGQQRAKERAGDTFAPTEDGWTESPWLKTKELLGGSLPYMAAPIVAGGAATVAGAPALAATGLAGLASAAQFTATNLDRQTDDRKLKDTDLSSAVLAAVPQAALDMIGLGRIPGVRQLIGAVAKDVGVDGAKSLVGQSLKQTVADYAKTTGKAMGAESITEAGQQVLERLQAGLKINDPAARKEYWDSFVGGAVLGGALSPAGRYVERGQIQNKERALAKVQETEQQAKQAAEAQQQEAALSAANESTTGPALAAAVDNSDPRLLPRFAPQPDMFGGAEQANAPAPDLINPRQALAEHEQTLDLLRTRIKEAHEKGDLAAVMQLSKIANDTATKTKALQEAAQVGSMPPRPTVPPTLAAMQKKLAVAVENGDTAQISALAPKVQALEAQAKIANGLTSQEPTTDTSPTLWQDADEKYAAEMDAQQSLLTANGVRAPRKANDPLAQFAADSAALDADRQAGKEDLRAEAMAARGAPKPAPAYAQQNLLDTADTEGARSDAKLEDAATKLTETVVDPNAIDLEKQIADLEDARDQAKANGRDDYAATYQARIGELQRRGRVNPHDADIISRVDTLHKQLEQAKRDAESARATKNVSKAESANKTARDIADQMAQVQQEPGSVAGRLIKAKNDTSSSLTAFFDAAHEIHTAGTESRLREKQTYLRSVLNDMRNRGAVNDRLGEGQMHVSVADVLRQLRAIEAQIGSLGAGESPKMVAARARQAITKYVRAAFREENIRREARNQKPLEGAAREAFAKHAQKKAESVLTRVMADRGGDYMEERVVQPAVMRSGKVIRGAVTEFRDSRALKDRPYAKFSRAREVEEESFLEQRAALQHKSTATRVESGALKRQWAADEAKRTADEQGENATTRRGQMRRRAEYLGNQLDASTIDVSEMRAALEQYPTNAVMDALAPMVKDARTGLPPDADNLQRLREAVALEKEVAQDNTGQKPLLDDSPSFERSTPARFQNAPEVKKGKQAAEQAKRVQHDTHAMLLRESQRAPTAGEQSMSVYEAGVRRREDAVAAAEQRQKMDAAVEERMRLDEMEQRLAKLPHTTVTREAEGAFAKLLTSGLRKEASGLEAMIEAAKAFPKPDADYIAKLEKLLAKSNQSYEQLDGQLPRKIERSAEAGTSEADDVLQPDDKWRRPSGADTKAAVSAAQKLEERNKGRGRGPTMVTERGPRKISGSGARRQPSVQSAMREGNVDAARMQLEHIEDLQEKLVAKQAEATSKKDVAKYAEYEARLEKAHEAAVSALADVQGKPKADAPAGDGVAKVFNDADTGVQASVETRQALRDGDVQGTIDGLIKDGSTPEVRALAAKLKPFLDGVKIGTDENVKHEGKSVAGLYEESLNKVTMHPDRLTEEDILHELTHAATSTVFNTPDAQLQPHVRAAKQAVAQMWESMRNSPTFFGGEYANVSVKEFASEVFSNPTLRAKMDNVGAPKTLLQRFVTAIARVFGGGRTASEKALAQIEQVLSPAQMHFRGEATAKTMVDTLSAQLYAPKTTALERLTKNFGLRFEQSLVDMRAPLDQALKTGKGEAAAQAMYFMRKADARMSHVYAVLSEGALKLVKGAKGHFIIEAGNSASAKDLFEKVGKLKGANTAQKMATADLYMKAIRAKRVGVSKMDLGKTTEAQLNALLKEVDSDPEQKAAMDEVRRVYNDYNRGMIEFLAESGAIPKALAKELLKHGDYVPYYRVKGSIGEFMFDEEHPITIGDVRHQKYLQELKGDDDKFLPLNEAVMRNTLLLTDMAMRNIAAKSVAYAMQDIGKGKGPVSAKTGKPTNLMSIQTGYGDDKHGTTVRFNQEPDPSDPSDDGKRHIKIQTEGTAAEFIPSGMLAQSIEGMSVTLPSFLKGAGWFSDVLRSGVTRNPMYVMRQLIRDPLSAAFTSGLDTQPLTAVAKSMAEFGRQMTGHSPTAAALIRKGVLHSQIFNGSPSDLAKMSLQIAGGNNEGVYKLFAMADKAAMAADSATRAQMYESVIRRGGSEMEAEMAAIEMMNFHKRGGSPGALYASRMIPFFNAQIQGLNVLVKAASGKATLEDKLQIREKFINRALGLAAFTTLYAAAMSDDEEYKNARPRDRYSNFFIPLPNGTTIKAPIPFEVGLLFKALPEAFIDYMRDEFHEEEWQAVRHMLISSIPGAASWGMPQAVKPLVEVVANHDFYTGNPIESAGMEKLTPEMRFNANTTELAKQLSSGVGGAISPVKLEKLVNGYLGGLPVAIAALANEVFNTSGIARPERKLTETPVFGSAFQDVNGGGATDAMYAKIKALNEAKASAKKLEEMGDMQGVERLHTEVIDTLTGAVAGEAEKVLQELSKTEREIRLSDLTPERKREELDRVAADRTREMQRFLKITREATEPA